MDELTGHEVAERAGVTPEVVERYAALGILTPRGGERPFSQGDVKRARLARSCEEAGLPMDGIGAAIGAGKLSFAFLELPHFRWRGLSATTYRQLGEEAGIPLEVMLGLVEVLGFARPGPEDLVPENDLDLVPPVQLSIAAGVDPSAILRLTRVYGESLRRLATAEVEMFHGQVEMPLLRSGAGQGQIMELAAVFGGQVAPLVEAAVLAGYRRQQEHAWIADIIEHVEAALEETGVHRKVARPPAMCFLDLAGYTRLTEERGDEAAAELAASLATLVQGVSQHHGGRPVKWLGDGVMFHFPDPGQGVVAALEMVERTPDAGLPPAHVGLDAGPVVQQDGDYFGRTVNVAARIASGAGPGEVLVSDEVVHTSREDGVRFEPVGPVGLKNVSRPVTLFRALRA